VSPPVDRPKTGDTRIWIFGLICLMAAIVVGAAIARAILRKEGSQGSNAVQARALPSPPARPYVMFRSLIPGPSWGRLALAPLSSSDGSRYLTELTCERVHFAADRGVCLTAETALVPTYTARLFNEHFEPLSTIPLTGPPSRARMSPNGRWAAVTVFEQGHSYADAGFSTRTTLIDTLAGKSVADLEQFAVSREGQRFHKADFNFWGVTFTHDNDRFFATLSSGGAFYLVEGSAGNRQARVVSTGVECPSLSPDNTRIAFKKRVPRGAGWEWELWVLDLATMSQTPVAGETRSIDDQVEWLDDSHITYEFPSTDGNNIWRVATAETSSAEKFVTEAWSPAVVR
jgi:hypothetical protein